MGRPLPLLGPLPAWASLETLNSLVKDWAGVVTLSEKASQGGRLSRVGVGQPILPAWLPQRGQSHTGDHLPCPPLTEACSW
jgi:hypothetical protein